VPVGTQAVVWVMAAGVVAGQVLPWRGLAMVLAVVGGAGWAIDRLTGRGAGTGWLAWMAAALVAIAAGALRLQAVERPALAPDHVARLALPLRATVHGEVEELQRGAAHRAVVVLRATAIERAGRRQRVSGRVRLAVRAPLPKLRVGDGLHADATLRRPRNFRNPGSFDLVGHLARRAIRVTAAVWDPRRLRRSPRRTRGLTMRLQRWRERLGRALARAVPGPRAAVLAALVLGDDHGIPASVRTAFTRAGVVHVLSVSGLHVGLVGVISFAVLRWLLARSERLLLSGDVVRLAALLSLGPVAAYGALAGFEVATARSVLMGGCGVFAVLLGRRADVLRSLALAALALALTQPGAPREIGFQLSFGSVLALVLGVRRWAGDCGGGPASRVRTAVVVSAAALAGTAPLSAFHFRQVSVIALVANPVVVPLFGSIVVVLGLLGAFLEPLSASVAAVLFRLAGAALRPGLALVDALARPAWAALDVPRPTPLELVLLYGLVATGLLPAGRWRRGLAIVAVTGLLADAGWWAHVRWRPGVLRVTFLDVGQGDAAVAELPDGRVLVVDAGGFPGSDFDTGAAVVAPYLATRKIMEVDVVVMTHAHPDHAGGLPSLLARYRPREFWWTGRAGRGDSWARLARAMAETGVRQRVVAAGTLVPGWGRVVEVLHPPADWPASDLNDSSLTLRLTYGTISVLLTGDIEAAAESHLLGVSERLASAALKVPHHGSRTSSTPRFVDAVAPRVAIVSVGTGNRYGLPSPEVEARYRAHGTCLLRTDRCGAVTVVSDGRRLEVTTVRPDCGCR
jgi:competence protein ComEC